MLPDYALIPVDIARTRLNNIKKLKKRLEETQYLLEVAQREGRYEEASRLRFSTIPDIQTQLSESQHQPNLDAEDTTLFIHDRVTSDDISRVVAKSTGIPVQNLLKSDIERLVNVRIHQNGSNHMISSCFFRWRIFCAEGLWAKITSSLQYQMLFECLGLASKCRIVQSGLSCFWVRPVKNIPDPCETLS